MAKPSIEPRILKGFRDLLPAEASQRLKLFEIIRNVFDQACYQPIDTPALEYTEILLGKGSDETDKQLFRFTDQGGRDIALRFDLTVPLARYVSQYRNELNLPFRRSHIAPVWRAEKPQKGRYREFYQCDFDIIGSKNISSDIETLITVSNIFEQLGFKYKVRLNHRVILNSLIEVFAPDKPTQNILRAIDKLEKLGSDAVETDLTKEAGLEQEKARALINFLIKISQCEKNEDIILQLKQNLHSSQLAAGAITELETIFQILDQRKLELGSFNLDISIARGLDYYTGLVFETQLLDFKNLGSVCSGGRYDNLASLFSSQELPGVGGSVGIDRLMVALAESKSPISTQKPEKILVTVFSEELLIKSFEIALSLRAEGINCEVFSGSGKMGNQLKYADKNHFHFAIILGPEEVQNNSVLVKNLNSKDSSNQNVINQKDLIAFLKQIKNDSSL